MSLASILQWSFNLIGLARPKEDLAAKVARLHLQRGDILIAQTDGFVRREDITDLSICMRRALDVAGHIDSQVLVLDRRWHLSVVRTGPDAEVV